MMLFPELKKKGTEKFFLPHINNSESEGLIRDYNQRLVYNRQGQGHNTRYIHLILIKNLENSGAHLFFIIETGIQCS